MKNPIKNLDSPELSITLEISGMKRNMLIISFVWSIRLTLCMEHELVSDVIDALQYAYTKGDIQKKINRRMMRGGDEKLHNVSACHLPKSRQIIQKRYQ
ncbi:unnamed protein product [Phaedon cochleariae]|uniref:Uncharacterized protein n=1 Tax=Phaedon cochleariae TaxID=80249 RepID=A0A9N9X3F7_PHACE|nr:unnamed protein product [Phaedon cochleariae]